MITELETFRVKAGQEQRAREWMRVLVARQQECIETLEREKMALESIFMLERDGRLFLSWFSVQGEGCACVRDSDLAIDQVHCEFWAQCIDSEFQPEKFEHVVTFAQEPVRASLGLAASSI